MIRTIRFVIFTWAFLFLVACGAVGTNTDINPSEKLQVVAATTIVGDVVANVGGDHVDLRVLLPPNADPHGFEPAPADARAVAGADIIFINGIGFETFMDDLLDNAGGGAGVVSVSEGVELLAVEPGGGDRGENDPHVWFDPTNVIIWAENIAGALSALDPNNAGAYRANAGAYIAELQALDAWAKEQIAQIPAERRKMVTGHDSLGYFAAHYGFEIVGAVIPAFSTLAEPSAQELAGLEDAIADLGVAAVFVGTTIKPSLAERVAEDTGTTLVPVYTGSLSDADGPAATYPDMMRYNVRAIVEALK